MNKLEGFLNDKLIPLLEKLSGYRWIRAMRDGLIAISTVTIIASVFVVLAYIPFEGWQNLIAPVKNVIAVPGDYGMGIISLIVSATMAISFAKYYELDSMTNAALSLFAFIICNVKDYSMTTEYFGATGMFLGIICAIYTTFVNYTFKKNGWTIKMPEGVPEVIADVFQALIAGFVVLITFWLIVIVFNIDLVRIIEIILSPLTGLLNNAWGVGLLVGMMCFMWVVGLHESLFYGIIDSVGLANIAANSAAFAAGQEIPYVFTTPFLGFNLWLGGSGGTLGLAILLLLSKSKSLKALGRVAAPSTFFQVNEPITFGVPIVFNPILAIPYVLGPAVLAVITFYLMQFNIIGRTVVETSCQVPPILYAWFATAGDIRAVIWYCIEIVISVLMYLPFFKAFEKRRLVEEEQGLFDDLELE